MIFEFREKISETYTRRVLVINNTFVAYEQPNGSVVLNNEGAGFSFHPDETYDEFSKRILTQQHFMYEKQQ